MGSNTRARGRIGALAVASLAFGGLVAAAPASAADPVDSSAHWGFRQSFRNYVGNPGNTAPEPIAPQSPAVFDGAGDSVTRPYAFPVAAGLLDDADNFSVALAGGVTYSYPAHTFTIDLSDIVVIVAEGDASVVADVRVDTTSPDFEPVAANNVVIASSTDVSATLTSEALSVDITDLTLSATGSAALQGYLQTGDELDDISIDVALVEGEIPWTPYLSVLSNVVGVESTDIVVRGYGFEYGAKEFNRIPGVDGVVGPYVALGTVVDPWRPSLGGPSANRNNVAQIWPVEDALLADPRVGGAGGVLFEEDGSFAGTLSGAASDFADKLGRAAVYSYTTGPAIAAWELETAIEVEPPVTKADAKVDVKVKKKFRFAVKRKATITVDAPAGVAATGAVVVKAGKKVVGKGTVTNGKAKVTLTKKLLPGKRSLVAEFAGNAELAPATSAAVKVQVKKAKSKTKPKIAKKKKLKAGTRPVLRLRVTGKNVKPKGKVRIVVREGKKKIRTITVRVKGGKVTKVRLPRVDRGKYQVRAKFMGNKKIAKSAKKITFRVR